MISSTTETLQVHIDFGTRFKPIGARDRADWENRRPRWKQVHGVAVARVSQDGQECGEVDALWTDRMDQPIGVVTADCVPILLWRRDLRAVGAIHAGWRGTFERGVERFFEALPPEHSDPAAWIAVLGPSIRACCYEVGKDLLERFAQRFPPIPRAILEPSPDRLDLIAVNKSMLEGLGVGQVLIHADCTFCTPGAAGIPRSGNLLRSGENLFDPLYCSYRRGDRDSRQISIISLGPRV